jgi:tripartite-type tricarboxylate transporter receptor subunit TctC
MICLKIKEKVGAGMLKMNAVWVTCLLFVTMITGGCSSMQSKSANAPEKYPARPITIIVPFSAGGTSDIMARMMEKTAVQHLGQPLVVVSKPGGGGTIGWNEFAGANPDGYTIGVTGIGLLLQPLYGSTRYNYMTALYPLAQVGTTPVVLAVRADQPWQTLEDLVSYAKQHPGAVKYGHAGLGTISHVTGEIFAKEAGIAIEQVPFSGGSEGIAATLGGHIHLSFILSPDIKEYVKSGKIRVLAVGGEKRLTQPDFAQVPTFREQGLDITFSSWQGVAAPKELPEDVRNKLAKGLKGMINDPVFIKSMEDMGLVVEYLGPQESLDQWISDNTKLAKIVKETGIAERIASQKK